ncbi:MAG: hypothetical protein LBH91_00555 [Prevotellaceae bacterium]|nr:hypothetical protein [Prevotellaceae bacterium]
MERPRAAKKRNSYRPSEYIAFEVVSEKDYLNECKKGRKPTRGNNCTSIDALIYAEDESGKKYIFPIEWKYTEYYDNGDKSIEDSNKKSQNHKKGDEAKGTERLDRYSNLITKSTQLKDNKQLNLERGNYKNSVYFFEPFYQLMRQTLWVEQMTKIENHKNEELNAIDYIHIHVIPKENDSLLDKIYPCSKKKMKTTWNSCLKNEKTHRIISPEEFLNSINDAYLRNYLETRYW